MKTVIEMARQAGEVLDKEWLERFASLFVFAKLKEKNT